MTSMIPDQGRSVSAGEGIWRYDVFTCNNRSTDVGAHDGDCFGWRRVGAYRGYFKEAYRQAIALPHGLVIRAGFGSAIGWSSGTLSDVFEHRSGGSKCEWCTSGRGLLVNTYGGAKFMCRRCQSAARCDEVRRWGGRPGYNPVIEAADIEAVWPDAAPADPTRDR